LRGGGRWITKTRTEMNGDVLRSRLILHAKVNPRTASDAVRDSGMASAVWRKKIEREEVGGGCIF